MATCNEKMISLSTRFNIIIFWVYFKLGIDKKIGYKKNTKQIFDMILVECEICMFEY